MTGPPLAPRKQRTRQHVIADLSVHHVEGFILEEGHTAFRLTSDYGYDMMAVTHDSRGFVEPGVINFQMKAAEALEAVSDQFVFDLDVRDYNLWNSEKLPVILILYDASRKRAYWLHVQDYFQEDPARQPRARAKTVRVRVPSRQVVNRRAIARIRDLKSEAHQRLGVSAP